MPNLTQMLSLKEKYGELSTNEKELLEYYKEGLEKSSLSNTSFSFGLIKEAFDQNAIKPSIIDYFNKKKEANVVLLFLDITNFSTKMIGKKSFEITEYLDSYYKKTMPIIYSNGGQIEKLMGDGIICVFGEPFLSKNTIGLLKCAEKCAKSLLNELVSTKFEIKIAVHSGEVRYYKTPCDWYEEYTIIGSPITDLFRLESVSTNNKINYFENSEFDSYCENKDLKLSPLISWSSISRLRVSLKGTKYTTVKYFGIK